MPDSPLILRELNIPAELIADLVGKTVTVQILQEEARLSYPIAKPDEYPFLIKPDGTLWNDYLPLRVLLTTSDGRVWRLPRYWLDHPPETPFMEPPREDATLFVEIMNLPSVHDLQEANIGAGTVLSMEGQSVQVAVRVSSQGVTEVFLRDDDDGVWRLPHNWRRRRIMLPDRDRLMDQGVPGDIAVAFSHKIATVNYHPGSLCCLPNHYRFKDDEGNKWPARIADCTVVGFGNEPTIRA